MQRSILVAAALALLVPSVALAQTAEPIKPGGRAPAPHAAPAAAPRPVARPQPAMHAPAARPQAARERPALAPRPLPPRADRFYHRGQDFARIHGPAYAYPAGWHYRRWDIGLRLPPALFAPGYYYDGWAALGLQGPPPGYTWVRFGPDLLLVNIDSGEVEDVAYGVFL